MHRFLLALSILSLVGAACLVPRVSLAHAVPLQYTPDASLSLSKMPTEVAIVFSERLEPAASSITVLTSSGELISGNTVVTENPRELKVPLSTEARGVLTVSWQVVSKDDGHFTKGAYAFAVGEGAPSTSPTVGMVHGAVDTSNTFLEAFFTFLELLGHALMWGAMVVYLFVFRPLSSSGEAGVIERLQRLFLTGIFLLFAGSVAHFILSVHHLSLAQGGPFVEAFHIFIQTSTGFALASLATLALLLFGLRRGLTSRVVVWNLLIAVLLLLVTLIRAKVSHATASLFAPTFSVAVNFFHLLSKNAWIGGLVAVTLVFWPVLSQSPERAKRFVRRFSKLLTLSFFVVGTTGCYIVWLHLKSFVHLEDTVWGERFLVLLGVAVLLVFIRTLHAFVEGGIFSRFREKLPSWYPLTLFVEALVGISVLFFSALLIITTPPLETRYFDEVRFHGALSTTFSFEENMLHLTYRDAFHSLNIKQITVVAEEKVKSIGPIVVSVMEGGEGKFSFETTPISVPGTWIVTTTATPQTGYDIVDEFTVEYPSDFSLLEGAHERPLHNFFSLVMYALATSIILFSILLLLFSRWGESRSY